ncbi:MAG: AraC family transcriptional regulator [Bacteroidota bacterium]
MQRFGNAIFKNNLLYKDGSIALSKHAYIKGKSDMDMHHHDLFSISISIKGTVIENSTKETFIAPAGSLFVKPPGVLHSNSFTENATLLSFNFLDSSYYKLNLRQHLILPSFVGVATFFEFLFSKDKKENIHKLQALVDQHLNNYDIDVPYWLREVKMILNGHFYEPLSIKQLAREVNRHPFYVARTFKEFFGLDIKSYQRHLRIQHALKHMVTPDKNLTSIAYECGFFDQSHFTRDFKRELSVRPKQALKLLNV